MLQELIGFTKVLERNKKDEAITEEKTKIYFPFFLIEFAKSKTPKINIALNKKKNKVHFGFDEEVYGDLDVAGKIGNNPNFLK